MEEKEEGTHKGPDPIALPQGWFYYSVNPGVDVSLPGIYQWSIEGAGAYIGKYKKISRPLHHYRRNVDNLLNRKPYRKSNPDGFRRIHRELARAHQEGREITLVILENVGPAGLNRRERELIHELGSLN